MLPPSQLCQIKELHDDIVSTQYLLSNSLFIVCCQEQKQVFLLLAK